MIQDLDKIILAIRQDIDQIKTRISDPAIRASAMPSNEEQQATAKRLSISNERFYFTSDGRGVLNNLLIQGPDGFDAANETAILYMGDASSYLKASYGPTAANDYLALYTERHALKLSSFGFPIYFYTDGLYTPCLTLDNGGSHSLVGNLSVSGRIKSGVSSLSVEGPTDNLSVADCNTLFIDTTSNNVTIGGLVGGVAGQELNIIVVNSTNNTIIENAEGTGNQDIYLASGGDESITAGYYGGWHLVCDGTKWVEVKCTGG